MTVVNGKIVYAADAFKAYDPPLPPVSPDWSPIKHYGGYQHSVLQDAPVLASGCAPQCGHAHHHHGTDGRLSRWLGLDNKTEKPCFDNPWALGCGCFAY